MKLSKYARELLETITGRKGVEAVRSFQLRHGLTADGKYGPKTARALWEANRPTARQIVDAALRALTWPIVRYSMTVNSGLGESYYDWLDDAPQTGDCSDFAAHCIGIPKHFDSLWYGTDAIHADAVGRHELYRSAPLEQARPGDLIVYPGKYQRGERTAIGHVGVCVEGGARVITIDCASSNKLRGRGSAIARADKTDLWRKKCAIVARPVWHD